MSELGQGDDQNVEEVVDLGPLDLRAVAPRELPPQPVERTRALLAYLLLALLSAIIATLLVFVGTGRLTTEEFGSVAAVSVSPVIGLLGAATGYYYGKGDR